METTRLGEIQAELESLADQVEQRWEKLQFKLEQFPQLCEELLKNLSLKQVPDLEMVMSDLPHVKLPDQTFPRNEFSDFPMTLVRRKNFLIDIYFWLKSDTNIHDHNFCGAFKVIKGHSYQVDYAFEKTKQLGEGFEQGELTVKNHKFLNLNDVQAIVPWDNFIHHVFHLEVPTMTLCIRTDFFPERQLFNYFFPKYRLLHQTVSIQQGKWIKGLEIALQLNQPVPSVPLSFTEIVTCIYMKRQRRFSLTDAALEFLVDYVKKTDPDFDFFEVYTRQSEHFLKLKSFGHVSKDQR